jgi:hypothetical protein
MEYNLEKKEKPISKKEYIKLLEEHFNLTTPFRKLYLDERLPPIEKSILAYRDKYVVKHAKTVIISVLVLGFISSIAMGLIIIWSINEVIRYPVDYSLKNILIISVVFFLGKIKLKFFENI